MSIRVLQFNGARLCSLKLIECQESLILGSNEMLIWVGQLYMLMMLVMSVIVMMTVVNVTVTMILCLMVSHGMSIFMMGLRAEVPLT